MTERAENRRQPGFFSRLLIAGSNVLIPLYAGGLLLYHGLRWLPDRPGFVDALGYVEAWLYLPLLVLLPVALLRRSRLLLALAALFALLFAMTYGELYLPRLPVQTTGPSFKVMTFNILYKNEDPDAVAAEILALDADIVGLHELPYPMAQALEARLGETYPYRAIGYFVGLFSRYPIAECEPFRPFHGTGMWAQECRIEIDGKAVTLFNVHLRSPPFRGVRPFGLPLSIATQFVNQARDADLQSILNRMQKREGSILLIGDLNLTDRQLAYRELTGYLQDAHRESGWGMGFSYSRLPGILPALWRIDYVFHSADMVALSTRAGDFAGSDHRPVMAELAFRQEGRTETTHDLEGPQAAGADLAGADLAGADLWCRLLFQADLRGADLRGANLGISDLGEADLRGADLRGAQLVMASLRGAQIDEGTRLDEKWQLVWELVNQGSRERDLSGADLYGAGLEQADLVGAQLMGADLEAANLYRADLRGAQMSQVNLRGAILSAADLRGADLTAADLRRADLIHADLRNAKLAGADLEGASLAFADLRGADLSGADLSRANLGGAQLDPGQLELAASLDGAMLPDGATSP